MEKGTVGTTGAVAPLARGNPRPRHHLAAADGTGMVLPVAVATGNGSVEGVEGKRGRSSTADPTAAGEAGAAAAAPEVTGALASDRVPTDAMKVATTIAEPRRRTARHIGPSRSRGRTAHRTGLSRAIRTGRTAGVAARTDSVTADLPRIATRHRRYGDVSHRRRSRTMAGKSLRVTGVRLTATAATAEAATPSTMDVGKAHHHTSLKGKRAIPCSQPAPPPRLMAARTQQSVVQSWSAL